MSAILSVTRDVTQQEARSLTESAEIQARALQEAKFALQRQTENISLLAHELRTPLNSVLGLTNLLLGMELNPTQRELSEMTGTAARALLSIVNTTLDLSRPNSGEILLDETPFDLPRLMEEVGEILAQKAQSKGLDFVVRCAPTMPPRVIGDAGRIRQILTNLCDNAIKFTRQGYVLLRASHGQELDGMLPLVIEVEDTGVGIAPADQDAVFGRYVQAGSIPDGQEQGLGLGLAISREFAERMHGTLELHSQLGVGSVFRFTLRLPVDSSEAPTPSPDPEIQGAHILIAGRHPQQEALQELLVFWGARVSLCATTGEMLDAMQSSLQQRDPYEIVLLDEQMTGSDSHAILQAIITTAAFRQTRLLVLASAARSRDVERLTAGGLAVALTKPVKRKALREMLTRLLHMPRANPVIEEGVEDTNNEQETDTFPPQGVTEEAVSTKDIHNEARELEGTDIPASERRLYALVVEDDLVNQKVAMLTLERLGLDVDVASGGKEALELFETRVYDLLLIDCKMAGMDGYQVAAEIRRREGAERHTAIIAVTADTAPGVIERCLVAGMDAYISKPIQLERLHQEIEALLLNAAPVSAAPAVPSREEILDRRALMSRVAGNTEALRSLANLCQEECAILMKEIREAINTGDRHAFLRLTHKLRGMLMSMEAHASVEAVRRLERTANQGRPADAEKLLNPLEQELERLQAVMDSLLGEAER